MEEIPTRSDDGREFVIHYIPPSDVDAGRLGDPHATIPRKLGTYETAAGLHVNWIDDQTFEILAPEGAIKVHRIASSDG